MNVTTIGTFDAASKGRSTPSLYVVHPPLAMVVMTAGLFPLLDPRSALPRLWTAKPKSAWPVPPQPPGSAGPGAVGDSEACAEPLAVHMGNAHDERSPADCPRLLIHTRAGREGSLRWSACSATAPAAVLASG